VRVRAPKDALVFADGALGTAMQTGAAPVASSVDAQLRAMELAKVPIADPLQLKLRALLALRLADAPTISAAARELRFAPRTLQRYLGDRGSSWSHELDEARRERALVLLEDPVRKTADIATELGFRDASAFFRAFRRWTGTTPRRPDRTA
jgi:AraC-like DNA-binding protein